MNKEEWINVKDKYPKFGIKYRYLFVNGKNEVTFGYAYPIEEGWDTGNEGSIWICDIDRVTNEVARYWMELPNPPNKQT